MKEQLLAINDKVQKERRLLRRTGYVLGLVALINPIVSFGFRGFYEGRNNPVMQVIGAVVLAITVATFIIVPLAILFASFAFALKSRQSQIKNLVASLEDTGSNELEVRNLAKRFKLDSRILVGFAVASSFMGLSALTVFILYFLRLLDADVYLLVLNIFILTTPAFLLGATFQAIAARKVNARSKEIESLASTLSTTN